MSKHACYITVSYRLPGLDEMEAHVDLDYRIVSEKSEGDIVRCVNNHLSELVKKLGLVSV